MNLEPIMNIEDLKNDLRPDIRDYFHTLTKIIIKQIPVVGDPTSELFNLIITPPIDKRRDKWLEIFASTIIELDQRCNVDIKSLTNNETFITTLIYATQIAIRNHQNEKFKALRNAVLNSALPNAPDDDIQVMFLNYIDSFTVLHIKLLDFVRREKSEAWIEDLSENVDHQVYLVESDGSRVTGEYDGESHSVMEFDFMKVLEYEFSDFIEKNFIYEQVLKDLASKSMMMTFQPTSTFTLSSNKKFSTSLPVFGKMFIDFITSPF